MKRTALAGLLVAAIMAPAQPAAARQETQSPAIGTWTGKLAVGNASLTIVFHVAADSTGKLTGTMDSPDQGASGIPVSEVTFTDGVLKIGVAVAQGGYEGKLSEDGNTLTGEWQQAGQTFPLVLTRGGPPPRQPRPQEPVGPLPYDTEDVRFTNAEAAIELAGTITLPRSAGPHPAVVLISGSGAQDRDESLLGHKPFLVLADHLTRNGIAVLRYDDRGVGESEGSFTTATSADFVTDALAAVAFLKARNGIDPDAIGLIGHSEGGLIAPVAATRSDDVAFIVLMAGPGVPGEQILNRQIEKISRASGIPDADIERGLRTQNEIYRVLRTETDTDVMAGELRSLLRAAMDSASEAQRAAIGTDEAAIETYINTQIRQVMSPWFRYFLRFDPRPVLEQVKVPVLALNGELDLQVPPEQSLPEIEAALTRGGNADFTLRNLPGLNHLFQKATTGAPTEYAQIDETISPTALELMSSWINERFGAGR